MSRPFSFLGQCSWIAVLLLAITFSEARSQGLKDWLRTYTRHIEYQINGVEFLVEYLGPKPGASSIILSEQRIDTSTSLIESDLQSLTITHKFDLVDSGIVEFLSAQLFGLDTLQLTADSVRLQIEVNDYRKHFSSGYVVVVRNVTLYKEQKLFLVPFNASDLAQASYRYWSHDSVTNTRGVGKFLASQPIARAALFLFGSSSCFDWKDRGSALNHQTRYQESYDTLKAFMEHCFNEPFAPNVFLTMTSDISGLAQHDRNNWTIYREWLKKVLYYSRTTRYYCADADAIITTFISFPGRGFDQNGALAVTKYLLESGKCPQSEENYFKVWGPTRADQLSHWQDTVKNPEATPIDTTLPTLEDLGLGILRGPQGSVGRDESVKLEWLAVPNPFMDQVSIELNAPHPGIVRIELFHMLGRSIRSRTEEYILTGKTSLAYSVHDLEAGTYMLRVEFDGWQVRTQRIEKR